MKNLFTVILLLILVTAPVRTSHALFGQKQARYEAELQAAQAQDEVKKTKREAEEAITKAGEERERTDWTFGAIIVLLAASLAYALTHRNTVHQTVQQVVNVQAPPHEIVADTVVIDGTNVVRQWNGNATSLLRLLGVVLELQKRKYTFKCFFDANTFYVLREAGLDNHAWAYRNLLAKYPTKFIEVPGGTPADDAILDFAHRHGTPIISNDLYRDYKASYPWLENASRRRVPFVVHPTMVQLHRLGMEAKTPVSLNTAINEFGSLFETVSLNRQDKSVAAHSAPLQPA